MRLTKRQLKRIIKEEKQKLLKEWDPGMESRAAAVAESNVEENDELMDLWNQMLQEFQKQFPGIDTSYYGNKIFKAMEEEYAAAAADSQSRQSDF
jgi:hypothetical protein